MANKPRKPRKKITARFFVRDLKNGGWIDVATLPDEKRIEIATELNDRAMRAAGFVPVGENRGYEST